MVERDVKRELITGDRRGQLQGEAVEHRNVQELRNPGVMVDPGVIPGIVGLESDEQGYRNYHMLQLL